MNKIVKIPFHGNEIIAVEKNGRKYVAMKPIVEAMELEWNKQLELIKRDPVLYSTMTIMGIVAADGKERDMVCLPLEYLNGWLFKVPASRYTGKRQKVIELYQRECFQALYDYWHNGGAVNPRLDEKQAATVVGKVVEAGEGRFPEEITGFLRIICDKLDASTKALNHAAGRIVYLENFQPKGTPGEISESTGRPKDRFTRGYYTSNPRAKLLAALAMIPELPWEDAYAGQ
jgi:hypothetical protein